MRPTHRLSVRPIGRVGGRGASRAAAATALAAMLALTACHSAHQASGMDPNDLSDDRGAHAGRFTSPADNAATADNDTDSAGNGSTTESNQ